MSDDFYTHEPGLIHVPKDAVEVPREIIESVANILGEASVAANAIRKADTHTGLVRFWYSKSDGMLILELVPDPRH